MPPDKTPLIIRTSLPVPSLEVSPADRQVLRRLAGEVATLAARPVEAEKRRLWIDHNALRPTRPVIFCDPENSWHEIIPADSLECRGELARSWEWRLRREIFWGARMKDDRTIAAWFDIAIPHDEWDWGLHETYVGNEAGHAHTWKAPIRTDADLERMHFPVLRIDPKNASRLVELAAASFGDVLHVRLKTGWWWTLGMTQTLAHLRGLEQLMLDMLDNPAFLHRMMAFFRDGTLAMLAELEVQGLLCPNRDSDIGSGGLGWIDELPQTGTSDRVRLRDMWGFCESQETVSVSPRMFAEFVFPYQVPILEKFGLNCYGCCEPLDRRWQIVKQIPRLRRVSISPWADREKMAAELGDRYVFSMKPNPADLAMDTFDEEYIRAGLRKDLKATRNCHMEIVMKDNHTIRSDPSRVVRWVQVARQEAENT